jgi:hypothetical protein
MRRLKELMYAGTASRLLLFAAPATDQFEITLDRCPEPVITNAEGQVSVGCCSNARPPGEAPMTHRGGLQHNHMILRCRPSAWAD